MRQIYKAKNTGNRVLLHVVSEYVSSPAEGMLRKISTNQRASAINVYEIPDAIEKKKRKINEQKARKGKEKHR